MQDESVKRVNNNNKILIWVGGDIHSANINDSNSDLLLHAQIKMSKHFLMKSL